MSSGSSDDSSGSDAAFRRYQRGKWNEDLQSIQPINGSARHGAIMDRYDKRDVSR